MIPEPIAKKYPQYAKIPYMVQVQFGQLGDSDIYQDVMTIMATDPREAESLAEEMIKQENPDIEWSSQECAGVAQ